MPDAAEVQEVIPLPFERRCELARELLELSWKKMQPIIDAELVSLQLRLQATDARVAQMSAPAQEMHAQFQRQRKQLVLESSEQRSQMVWDYITSISTKVYGGDATQFAFAAFKQSQAPN